MSSRSGIKILDRNCHKVIERHDKSEIYLGSRQTVWREMEPTIYLWQYFGHVLSSSSTSLDHMSEEVRRWWTKRCS